MYSAGYRNCNDRCRMCFVILEKLLPGGKDEQLLCNHRSYIRQNFSKCFVSIIDVIFFYTSDKNIETSDEHSQIKFTCNISSFTAISIILSRIIGRL